MPKQAARSQSPIDPAHPQMIEHPVIQLVLAVIEGFDEVEMEVFEEDRLLLVGINHAFPWLNRLFDLFMCI